MSESKDFCAENVWVVFSGVSNHVCPPPREDIVATELNSRARHIRQQLRKLRATLFGKIDSNNSIQGFPEELPPSIDPTVEMFVRALWKTEDKLLQPVAEAYRKYQSVPMIRGGNAYYDPSTGQYDDEYYESRARLRRLRSECESTYYKSLRELVESICPALVDAASRKD